MADSLCVCLVERGGACFLRASSARNSGVMEKDSSCGTIPSSKVLFVGEVLAVDGSSTVWEVSELDIVTVEGRMVECGYWED